MSRHGDDDDDEGEGEGDGGEGTSDFSDETPPSPSCNRLPLNGNPSLAHPPCLHSLQQSELSSSEGIQVGTVSGLPMTGIVEMGLPIAGGQSTVHTQLDPMAHMAYPILDPYYCGLVASYGSPMFYQQMLGVQQVRRLLPSDMIEEEPVYVNAKQYHGIMRRRQSRAKAEMENKLVKSRKPYLHESRHLHAKRRARGCGGRFLKVKSDDDSKTSSRE